MGDQNRIHGHGRIPFEMMTDKNEKYQVNKKSVNRKAKEFIAGKGNCKGHDKSLES